MNRENTHTLAGSLVFLGCLAMIAALCLPRIARYRTAARQTACAANLKRVGLGFHNYHSAYKQLPIQCGGTEGETDETGNRSRLSALVGLLPFIDEQELWQKISNPYVDTDSGKKFPAMGPAPWFDAGVYKPWSQGSSLYLCPERTGKPKAAPRPKTVYTLKPVGGSEMGLTTNYVVCFGDAIFNIGKIYDQGGRLEADEYQKTMMVQRGMFMPARAMKFRDVLDGLSNTIMMSEVRASVKPTKQTAIAKDVAGLRDDPSLCLQTATNRRAEFWNTGRGSRWCDGAFPITAFQTILPPNSPSCTSEHGMFDGVMSASSDHPGGVHVLFGDGRVAFVTDSIEAGDSGVGPIQFGESGARAPGRASPYGLWGSMGTRAAKETIQEEIARAVEDVYPRGGSIPRTPRSNKDDFSKWTSNDGSVTLSAKFVRIIDKKTIELEDAGGTLHQVPLNTLKDQDIFRAVTLDLISK